MPESESEFEREQEDAAAQEAASIGGRVSSEPPTEAESELDESQRPLSEAGEGESEGFELAESELAEHASHGDEHSAGRILQDALGPDEDDRIAEAGEGDEETPPDE